MKKKDEGNKSRVIVLQFHQKLFEEESFEIEAAELLELFGKLLKLAKAGIVEDCDVDDVVVDVEPFVVLKSNKFWTLFCAGLLTNGFACGVMAKAELLFIPFVEMFVAVFGHDIPGFIPPIDICDAGTVFMPWEKNYKIFAVGG